ncbi:MAG: choice-of-anchor D domain-containing protein [Fimbriimonadaceae bacterium]|nr:choice-of-anchor D domain-containing protein [Fimbriimonadaceae bacterium]
MKFAHLSRVSLLAVAMAISGYSSAQLRVAQWNVTNYTSGRITEFQTAIYGMYEGRSMKPDVFIGQEFISQTSVNNFLAILNTAPGSPGDWAAAPFIDGTDTDGAFFYRTSKVDFLGTTIVAAGSTSTSNQPRNSYRHDVRLKGYGTAAGATLACYNSHMKSGSTSTDQDRRQIEASRVVTNLSTLPAGTQFVYGGDFNIQSSSQQAFQTLVGASYNTGPFRDPIKTPGSWNNNAAFRFVHTQDPAVQMDDRLDFLLVSPGLTDGQGFEYVGNSSLSYSTTTWNDPNHSYRAWGNDGTSYDGLLTVAGNTMVGSVIAQALLDSAAGLGHLPVFLDLKVPPKGALSTVAIDFGIVSVGQNVTKPLQVTNTGDVNLWTANGISPLSYTLNVGNSNFSVATGPYSDPAGGGSNTHQVRIDTTTPGSKSAVLTVMTNDPVQPVKNVVLKGLVKALLPPP